MAYGAIYRKTLNLNSRVKARLAVLLGVTLVTAACATGPLWSPPPEGAADPRATAPEFTFVSDTFAFANLIRARHRGEDDLYANYCFVLARGLRQFSQFARFDPALPRLDHDGYAGLVRRVVALPVWQPASSEDGRIVIPGYANFCEFSRAEDAAGHKIPGPGGFGFFRFSSPGPLGGGLAGGGRGARRRGGGGAGNRAGRSRSRRGGEPVNVAVRAAAAGEASL